jgi:hypothetical protein
VVVDVQHRTLVTNKTRSLSASWELNDPDGVVGTITNVMEATTMGRGILLWLLGVPIPVIILLWLFFGR